MNKYIKNISYIILTPIIAFILLQILLLLFFGLNNAIGGFAYEKKLNNGYQLNAMDSRSEMSIWLPDNLIIVKETVFAVGQNDSFIIVKQHPPGNKEHINYYAIPLINKISEYLPDNIYGPMNSDEFDKLKTELNINNLDFTIVFKDLEENNFQGIMNTDSLVNKRHLSRP